MISRRLLLRIAGVAAVLVAGCVRPVPAPTSTPGVTIFVAASTQDAVARMAGDFQRARNIPVTVVPGPSSGLARQIALGARADLFLSADEASADFLAGKGLIARRRNLLSNRLVVIVPAESKLKIAELSDLTSKDVERLALADAKVPAGEYARQALRKAGVLDKVEPKFIGGIDVRQALQYVAQGEADAGFVYFTDTVGNSHVRIAYEVPANMHRPIEYPLALLSDGQKNLAAVEFYDYLASPAAAEAFKAAKFGLAK